MNQAKLCKINLTIANDWCQLKLAAAEGKGQHPCIAVTQDGTAVSLNGTKAEVGAIIVDLCLEQQGRSRGRAKAMPGGGTHVTQAAGVGESKRKQAAAPPTPTGQLRAPDAEAPTQPPRPAQPPHSPQPSKQQQMQQMQQIHKLQEQLHQRDQLLVGTGLLGVVAAVVVLLLRK